ncbi:MAG: hypothetical protein IT159_06965 [Bryobacterales bacterium]|nr:hypothetical protein [Bryobacterales bacterium]
MSHPSETRLALYAGRELGVWSRWAVSRHVSRCSQCHDQVRAFVADKERLRRACAEFPAGLEWERLASEMTANIRVGLAAGECVGPLTQRLARPRWQRAVILAPVILPLIAVLVFVVHFQRPQPRQEFSPYVEGTVIAATAEGLELKQGDRMLTLRHPGAGEATYMVNAQGTMRADFVDADTGQVTIHSVYAQ